MNNCNHSSIEYPKGEYSVFAIIKAIILYGRGCISEDLLAVREIEPMNVYR